jgi:hypothetical protein
VNPFSKPLPVVKSQQDESALTSDEIELILTLLGETSFPVKKIEILYKALWKLQIQHQNQISKK